MHYLESMNGNPTVLCQKLWMMMILMMNVLPRSNWLIHLIKIVLLKNFNLLCDLMYAQQLKLNRTHKVISYSLAAGL